MSTPIESKELHTYIIKKFLATYCSRYMKKIVFKSLQIFIALTLKLHLVPFRPNKALIPKLQKFAKIGVVDGVSNFAPKIIIMKMDC